MNIVLAIYGHFAGAPFIQPRLAASVGLSAKSQPPITSSSYCRVANNNNDDDE